MNADFAKLKTRYEAERRVIVATKTAVFEWASAHRGLAVAARESDDQKRLEVSDRLTDFIMHSWPNDQVIHAMDEIAKRAAQDLLLQTVQDRVREIAGRTAEFHQLAKQFRGSTEEASAGAAEIRLQKARRVTQALTDSVNVLKDFRAALDRGSDADLVRSIEKAIETI
ncbi:MAG: hypothetical protein MZV70_34900 [Desulfobacterales bacterium]|nr:hypothetical protein [Desulfobacterales bacterium]